MSDTTNGVREAQFAFVAAYVRQLDPSVTDASIARYLSEIETMAMALQGLDAPDSTPTEPFTAEWPDGERA
jgi:hypothetical protein